MPEDKFGIHFFCKHCGRHWGDKGGSEPESPGLQPLPWPWEKEDIGDEE
jgi:hypothetical protein